MQDTLAVDGIPNASCQQNTEILQLGLVALPIPLQVSHGAPLFHFALSAFSSIFIHAHEKDKEK